MDVSIASQGLMEFAGYLIHCRYAKDNHISELLEMLNNPVSAAPDNPFTLD